jgi:hypothetical protein
MGENPEEDNRNTLKREIIKQGKESGREYKGK